MAPANNNRPVPRYSRRALLGPRLTDPANAAFRRNIADRLWALLMGRGLIHPVDLDHSGNPPSHPELLTLLADDLAGHKFDLRYFLRELALSREGPGVEDELSGQEALVLVYSGHLKQAVTMSRRGSDLVRRAGQPEQAAVLDTGEVIRPIG